MDAYWTSFSFGDIGLVNDLKEMKKLSALTSNFVVDRLIYLGTVSTISFDDFFGL